ncbi:transcriptional regulator domain-containing protein [Sphingomonas cannabina]
MWEWLRRDPDYIAWHARASVATRGVSGIGPDPSRWGLHFR